MYSVDVLLNILENAEPDLLRCLPPRPGHGRILWLLTHERVRHTPRVRTVIDFLYKRLKRHVSELKLAA